MSIYEVMWQLPTNSKDYRKFIRTTTLYNRNPMAEDTDYEALQPLAHWAAIAIDSLITVI